MSRSPYLTPTRRRRRPASWFQILAAIALGGAICWVIKGVFG